MYVSTYNSQPYAFVEQLTDKGTGGRYIFFHNYTKSRLEPWGMQGFIQRLLTISVIDIVFSPMKSKIKISDQSNTIDQ